MSGAFRTGPPRPDVPTAEMTGTGIPKPGALPATPTKPTRDATNTSKATRPKVGLRQALFGELPEGWRERRGLAPSGPSPATPRGLAHMPAPALSSRSNSGAAATGGSRPAKPRLGLRSWAQILGRVYKEFCRDRVLSVSGGVTFFALLALFPAITTLVSVYGLFSDPERIAAHLDLLNRILPPEVVDIIRGQIQHIASTPIAALTTTGIISLIVAIYSATGGMKALIESLNLAWFETETRGTLKLNLIGLCFTAGAIILILSLLAAIAVVPALLDWLKVPQDIQQTFALARWPAMFAVLTLSIAALYRWAPDRSFDSNHRVMMGAVLAAFALVLASVGFSWYVTHLAHYNQTYGSLGAVVVLMMWLWIATIIIMLGAELNAEVTRQIDYERRN